MCYFDVGDIMCFVYEKFSTVVQIKDVELDRKVNVEVENGLIYVNGVIVIGESELSPRVTFRAEIFFAHNKAIHFKAVYP